MSLNNLKKMIIFSNSRIKLIIENMVTDEAKIQKRSASVLIEQHLLNDLLPQNPNACEWLQLLYDGSWSIGDVLDNVFSWNSAGNRGEWSSRYGNLRPLVEFAMAQEYLYNTVITGMEKEHYHFCSQLDSVCNKLENLADKTTDVSQKYLYDNEAKWARELLKESTSIRFCDYYQLVLNNWDDLKDWSITFRMLSDLVSMEKEWRTNENTRYELTKILKIVSADWKE